MIAEELPGGRPGGRRAASPGTAGGTGATARAPAGRSRGRPRHPVLAIERDAAARHDHVHVRMMGHGGAPGMEDRGDADAGTEVSWIGRDGDQSLGRSLEQQIINDSLVLVGDVGDGRRQCEHDVVIIRHRQRRSASRAASQFLCRRALALRAVPVAATIVRRFWLCAQLLAARDMSAERRRAAVPSIADITLSWPRLTWPALARRHVGPWPRKMSATSSDGRDTTRVRRAVRRPP